MQVTTQDMPAVKAQFNSFHVKVLGRPNLYASSNQLTVTLDTDLLHFSNAAAGHSGFNSGARAVGIRINSSNPLALRDSVFASMKSFIEFLEDSDCNGPNYAEHARKTYIANGGQLGTKVTTIQLLRSIKETGRKLFGNDVFTKLVKMYGNDLVKRDVDALNLSEFALRYNFPLYIIDRI